MEFEFQHCGELSLLKTIAKYVSGYNVIFYLPTVFDSSKNESVTDGNYIPLLFNQDDEVISYIGYDKENGYELLLPVCQNKKKLIDELFSMVLPKKCKDNEFR